MPQLDKAHEKLVLYVKFNGIAMPPQPFLSSI